MNNYDRLDIDKYLDYLSYLGELKEKKVCLSRFLNEENEDTRATPLAEIEILKSKNRLGKHQKVRLNELQTKRVEWDDVKFELQNEMQRIANNSLEIESGWTEKQFEKVHTILTATNLKDFQRVIEDEFINLIYEAKETARYNGLSIAETYKMIAEKTAKEPIYWLNYYINGLPPKSQLERDNRTLFLYIDWNKEVARIKFYKWLKSEIENLESLSGQNGKLSTSENKKTEIKEYKIEKPTDVATSISLAYHFGLWELCLEKCKNEAGKTEIEKAKDLLAQCLGVGVTSIDRYISLWNADKNGTRSGYSDERIQTLPNAKKKLQAILKALLDTDK